MTRTAATSATTVDLEKPPLDPKIYYWLALDQDEPHLITPFQGFTFGWFALTDFIETIPRLQSDILEEAFPPEVILARRITGDGAWRALPISLSTLLMLSTSEASPFWVVYSATETIAKKVSEWIGQQRIPPLHVTAESFEGAIERRTLSRQVIRDFVRRAFEQAASSIDEADRDYASKQIANWKEPSITDLSLVKKGHFCTIANYMTLEGAGMKMPEGEGFLADQDKPYFDVILEGAREILKLRDQIGDVGAFRFRRPQPGLILSAPSMYRHHYKDSLFPRGNSVDDPAAVRDLIRMFQSQTGFRIQNSGEKFVRVMKSKSAQRVLSLRRDELEVHAVNVGMRAASTLAATLRLRPAVNTAASVVAPLAANSRAQNQEARRKFARLFQKAQDTLEDAVGAEFMEVINSHYGDIKLVSDVPLEWLPVRGLPLGIQFNASRITSTPGNLMAGELVFPRIATVTPEVFQNVLVISSFSAHDPIRALLPVALGTMESDWRDKIKLTVVEANSVDDFVRALNAFEGGLLIFDGHGSHNDEIGYGTLAIGREQVDVWDLRGTVRVPPAVILSACDTQAVDRSHATTANGFLSLGARAVLGTLLPIDARHASIFIGRLMLRLAVFVPGAIHDFRRALSWSEIVAGLLRMQYATDMLRPLLNKKHLSDDAYLEASLAANTAINSNQLDWHDQTVTSAVNLSDLDENEVRRRFQAAMPYSDTIKYVQLGNPETLLVMDSEIEQAIASSFVHPSLSNK